MRRNPGKTFGVLALGVAGLLLLGACSSRQTEGSRPLGATPTTTTTTTPDPSSTTTIATSSTVAPRAPVTTVPGPATPVAEYVNGVPQVKATPSVAAPGARVRIEGHGFSEATWRQPEPLLWLSARQASCALVAEAIHTVRVSDVGHLAGEFTVPSTGVCRMGDNVDVPLPGGRYAIAYQCTSCFIGEIEVTAPSEPVSSRCADIPFAANSDNLATDIVATGMTCAEAEALVRKVGGPLGPINGAPRAESDGFVCVRTSQNEVGLPTATYECTNGAKKVTFVR